MKHGVSLVHVDNSEIQSAIANNAHPDTITRLKANVAFNCVYGFEYHEVEFADLANLLCHDVGFNNFKFASVEKAIYDKVKHPDAHGLVRGVHNIISGCSWICFDVDVTIISDIEMHSILSSLNHHIARTSDPSKDMKYRVIVELTKEVHVTREEWKPFIQSIATTIGIGKIDRLPMSQVLYGYEGREVLSQLNGKKIDPARHLDIARMRVAELAERNETGMRRDAQLEALANPFTTFEFAFNAQVGDRWATSHAAIHKAKQLGASSEYIKELMYKINDFLDEPKPRDVVESSLFSAI